MFRGVLTCLAAAILLMAGGCDRRAADYRPTLAPAASLAPGPRPEFTFAVHPLHNPQLLFAIYGPLVDYLNARLPDARLQLVASNSYAGFEKRLAAREFAFALPNPYQTLQAQKDGYAIFGKMADDQNFRGVVLVRRDAHIRSAADLKGKVISYPAPTALAATMLPQALLRDHGLRRGDTRPLYVGSQESSIDSVYRGVSVAAGTWPPPWEAYARAHPAVAAAVEVKWRTAPLVNNGLVVRDDVPPQVRREVAQALFALQTTPEGRRILQGVGVSAFTPATARTYAPVAAFLARFQAAGGVDPARGTPG